MTALAGVELESLVSEPDALTTRPPQLQNIFLQSCFVESVRYCLITSAFVVHIALNAHQQHLVLKFAQTL